MKPGHKHVYYKKEEAKHGILESHGLTVMYKVSNLKLVHFKPCTLHFNQKINHESRKVLP